MLRQSGAALVAALLIIAIVATIAINLLYRSRLDIAQTHLLLSAEQAALDNTYALAFAKLTYTSQYATPEKKKDPNYVAPRLPVLLPQQKLGNATLDATFTSAQGLFNLNNLSDATTYAPLLAKLIQLVDPTIKEQSSLEIAHSIAYFINSKIDPEFEKNYTTLRPSYRPSHRLLTSPSELRLIDKVSVDLYQKLLPYLIALPSKTTLNPSVAPALILKAYGLTEDASKDVVTAQKSPDSFKNMAAFYALSKLTPNTQGGTPLFDLENQYFLLTSRIQEEPIHWTFYTILQADQSTQKDAKPDAKLEPKAPPTLMVIQQTRETL